MGVSSSQPDHPNLTQGTPSAAAPFARVSPDYSPGMDDFAASQQLMSESATNPGTEDDYYDGWGTNGRSNQGARSPGGEVMGPDSRITMADAASPSVKQLAARKKRKRDTTRRSGPTRKSQRQEATKEKNLRSSELASLQAYVDEGNKASNDQGPVEGTAYYDATVEVPNSQHLSIVDTAPLSPPMTSSVAIPASMPELPFPSTKATREEEDMAREASQVLENDHSQATEGGASDPGSASASSSQRSHPQDEDTPLEEIAEKRSHDEVEEMDATQEADVQVTDTVINQPPTTRKLKSRRSLPTPQLVEAAESCSKKRQRKLRRAKSSHFDDPIEEPTEESAPESDRIFNNNLARGSPQVQCEKLRSVRKAKRPRSKEEAAQVTETPAASIQPPSEPLQSPSDMLREQSKPLQALSDQVLPKVGSSSNLLKNHQKSELYDWHVSPSKDIESTPDLGDFDEDDLDSIADSAQAEGVATDDISVKDVDKQHIGLQDGDAEMPVAEISARLTPNEGDHQKTTKQRRSKNTRKRKRDSSQKQPRESEDHKVYKKKNLNTITAAEEALQNVRDLPVNPDTRTSGDFTADEEELIRRAIRDYQQMRGWEVSDIVRVIQWTMNDSNDQLHAGAAQDQDSRNSEAQEFWDDINRTLVSGTLTRSLDAVRKHIRSHYHGFKRGGWTKEEDDELLQCFEQAPRQWKAIGNLLGRSKTDVHARWSEYLQHRDRRQYGRWTDEEEAQLIRAVNIVAQRDEDALYEAGHLPREAYTAENIIWSQVVAEMGNTRGRLQASVKWKKMMARNEPPEIRVQIKPRGPDAQPIPASTPQPRSRTRTGSAQGTRRLRSKAARRQKKAEPSTRTSHQPEFTSVNDAAGAATMLWGDKLDLIEIIAEARYQREEDIDWDATAAKLKQTWSTRTLQAALHDLLATVESDDKLEEQQSLQDRLDEVIDYLGDEHLEELTQHYNPFDVEMKSDIGHDEEDTIATRPNTKRKRKVAGQDSLPESQPTSQGKKQKTTVDGLMQPRSGRKPRISMKPMTQSEAIITESDEADSAPEL